MKDSLESEQSKIASKKLHLAMTVFRPFFLALAFSIFPIYTSALEGITVTYGTGNDLFGNPYHQINLDIDGYILASLSAVGDYDGGVVAPSTEGGQGPSVVSQSYNSLVLYLSMLSLSGDNAISYKLTNNLNELVTFINNPQPSSTNSSLAPVTIETSAVSEYASESYTNGNPNTIWYKTETTSVRPKSYFLSYIGEKYSAWTELVFTTQENGNILVSVLDYEIVNVENKNTIRIPVNEQYSMTNVSESIDITFNNDNSFTVRNTSNIEGTYIIQESLDLINWSNVSTFTLSQPGTIEFSTRLPTNNTYEVWEYASDDITHPNYYEGYIMLDEPVLESTPIPNKYIKIVYQTP
jgi:hypothetical protein